MPIQSLMVLLGLIKIGSADSCISLIPIYRLHCACI